MDRQDREILIIADPSMGLRDEGFCSASVIDSVNDRRLYYTAASLLGVSVDMLHHLKDAEIFERALEEWKVNPIYMSKKECDRFLTTKVCEIQGIPSPYHS